MSPTVLVIAGSGIARYVNISGHPSKYGLVDVPKGKIGYTGKSRLMTFVGRPKTTNQRAPQIPLSPLDLPSSADTSTSEQIAPNKEKEDQPREPLTLYIQKGDITHSTLYLSIPDDEQMEYPTLGEYLDDSGKDLWQYIEDNGICDDIEISEHIEEGTDPTTLIGDLDEEIDGSSYAAEEWIDQYVLHESPEALAFDFLDRLLMRHVPGVALVQGDRPGSNLTFVEIEDSKALNALQKALGEEGYEVTIERF
jgi:hypothetical protein